MEAERQSDGESNATWRPVAEALIFASSESVSSTDIRRTIADVTGSEGPTAEELDRVVESLNRQYEERGSGLHIHRWGGGYRMATTAEMAPFLKAHFDPERHRRLTRSLLETLAILAYRQPVTKPEVDFIRGVDSDYAIRRLLELGLVDVIGRSDSVGRPLLYGTTPRFLEEFGLEAIDELPRLREIEELLGDPNFNQERARLLALEVFEKDSPEQDPSSDVDRD